MKTTINYHVDSNGTLHIYDTNRGAIISQIMGCQDMTSSEIDNLIDEVLIDLEYNENTI